MLLKVQTNGDHDMIFDDEKVITTVMVPMTFTEHDIDCLICTAFEGGTNYWMGLDVLQPEWEARPKGAHGVPLSEWSAKILLEGGTVHLYNVEDKKERWELTLEKLKKGIALNAQERPTHADKDNWDAADADCIIQYALFGKLVFG